MHAQFGTLTLQNSAIKLRWSNDGQLGMPATGGKSSASHFPILRQHQGLLGENITIFLGFDSFADDAVVGEQSELAGFHIF
jgi:hypothetical protein